MLFIYTPQRNPRIEFILNYVFTERLSLPVEITDTPVGGNQAWINYSNEYASKSLLNIPMDPLMTEHFVRETIVGVRADVDFPRLFPCKKDDYAMDFDVFAHCFYLLSRYEEYLPFEADEHGRFPSTASLATKYNFLHRPVVDLAIEELASKLSEQLTDWTYIRPKASLAFTYDIDAPFAYHGKPFWRNTAGAFRDILNGRIADARKRLSSMGHPDADPYQIFNDLIDGLKESQNHARFFVLLNHKGKFNSATSFENKALRELLLRLQEDCEIGIHPSYDCHTASLLKEELERFRDIFGTGPKIARYHFLRIQIPESLQLLVDAGIGEDHSMAYADKPGFRAGTAFPFPFYDLQKEVRTPLTIYPACLMDATFEYYMKERTQAEIESIYESIIGEVAKVGGVASLIFHNDLISNHTAHFDWKSLHNSLLTQKT